MTKGIDSVASDVQDAMDSEDEKEVSIQPRQDYTCVRCGYKYSKQFDYEPFLCHRCMRFLSKKLYTVMHTIVPPNSVPGTEAQ